MKKLLLSLVAFVATMGAFAQDEKYTGDWNSTFTPVSNAEELDGLHVAQAGDGSVYVSSTYDQTFTFAGKSVKNDDAMTSAVIVKYNDKGEEQWAVSLYGKALVTAMETDRNGVLYAGGLIEDEVICTAVDGSTTTFNGNGQRTGFLLKFSAAGQLLASKIFTPTVNAEVYAVEGDPYEMGFDMPIYDLSGNDPMDFRPTSIKVVDGRVYVAVTYMGDVEELGWKGAYLNYYGMDFMITDVRSRGIFSMDADLVSSKSEMCVQQTGIVSMMSQASPRSLVFAVKGGKVFVAITGSGELTATSASGSNDIVFNVDDDGNEEFGIMLLQDGSEPFVFHTAIAEAPLGASHSIQTADLVNNNIIISGTFHGDFPLTADTEVANYDYAYVASISLDKGAIDWAYQSPSESSSLCMVATGEETHAITSLGMMTFDTATGTVKSEPDGSTVAEDADSFNDLYAVFVAPAETSVQVVAPKMNIPLAIKDINTTSQKANGKYFQNGQVFILKNGVKYNMAGQRIK